jgi:hypothetical protein
MTKKAPIAFIIFNRPDLTLESFKTIRQYQPKKLFIIADGPRKERPGEIEKCKETRSIVANIDWQCEVYRNYSDENLSSAKRIRGGLHWVFENVDRAIILEDDCVPNPDFFNFCETLLEFYKEDERVWAITGDNFQDGKKRGNSSYYFSKYSHCWGWATWSRSWNAAKKEDFSFWPTLKDSKKWEDIHPNKNEKKYWSDIFDDMYSKKIDFWAYWFLASVMNNSGLTVTPNVNLVTNIGFGPDATNTIFTEQIPGLKSYSISEIIHPHEIMQDLKADSFVYNYHYGGNTLFLYRKILRLLKIESYAKSIYYFFKNLK